MKFALLLPALFLSTSLASVLRCHYNTIGSVNGDQCSYQYTDRDDKNTYSLRCNYTWDPPSPDLAGKCKGHCSEGLDCRVIDCYKSASSALDSVIERITGTAWGGGCSFDSPNGQQVRPCPNPPAAADDQEVACEATCTGHICVVDWCAY
ncbi:hypothetical protein BGZ63DRAFT_428448 [Mariannaea sp. PMI_226]|nr:hypothetical protein BGZ63DRAFT_428448 [Mariannaea sp. PMI_226]